MNSFTGQKIVDVRAMTQTELDIEGWEVGRHGLPAVILLENGSKIYASRDAEGNGPGSLFGTTEKGEAVFIKALPEGMQPA